jgi:uncharacterized membrane protein YfcA
MTMTATTVLFLVAVFAFSLSAVCGGGAGLLLMPVLGWLLPVSQLPATLSIGTSISSASRLWIFFHSIRWNFVRWFVPAAIPGVLFGAYLLKFVNPIYLEIMMGLFLIGNLPALFKKSTKENNEPQRAPHGLILFIGFMAGFLSGLTGAVGLLFNRFYLRHGLSKEEIVATRAANEIFLHIIKLILYASFGLLTGKVLTLGVSIAIAALFSSWLMKRGLTMISEVFFRKIGYGAMVFSGMMMLSQSGSTLFSQNNASLSFAPFAGGIESKLQWQKAHIAIEFEFDEGFEYEQQIEIWELPIKLQGFVEKRRENSTHAVIEEVFGVHKHSYEAYYFDDKGNLLKKIDFI